MKFHEILCVVAKQFQCHWFFPFLSPVKVTNSALSKRCPWQVSEILQDLVLPDAENLDDLDIAMEPEAAEAAEAAEAEAGPEALEAPEGLEGRELQQQEETVFGMR